MKNAKFSMPEAISLLHANEFWLMNNDYQSTGKDSRHFGA